jgi:serine/threonine protein kinase
MEYVHGQSLLKVMRAVTKAKRPLPLEHSLNIIIGTCAGLQYAHDKLGLDGTPLGIVHRDVSPPNIIITYDGLVKVVDFGIAKAATAKSSTGVGQLKGKIPYMSPEQCRSEPLDRRSDIFSIGILLYELTVGRRLFSAETEVAIIRKITAGGFTPPTSVHPHYPGELEATVMRALQLSPDSRYANARDLQIELEEFAREYKLSQSSAKLAAFMEALFDEEARRWPTNPSIAIEAAQQAEQQASLATPLPSSAPSSLQPPAPSADMKAFDNALSRLLEGAGEDITQGIGEEKRDTLGIDLDNLEVEDLVPSKFNK